MQMLFYCKDLNSWIMLCISSRYILQVCIGPLFKMDLTVYIQLIFLCVVNIILTLSGIILNTLVIASFWKSSQLRKKLCHFMIMVLSCFDLLAVVTNEPVLLLYLISWLREDYDLLFNINIVLGYLILFLAFPVHLLAVMSIEQYLGVYYPIFHRTSVTRRRLLTLLAILLIFQTTLYVISTNDMILSRTLAVLIFAASLFSPLLYINFKLFKISREVRRRKAISPEQRTTISLKRISTCLLVVACLVVLSISSSVYIVFNSNCNAMLSITITDVILSRAWSITIYIMNCTFNSLIFFWKNKVLRTEGIKILKTLKDRLVRF